MPDYFYCPRCVTRLPRESGFCPTCGFDFVAYRAGRPQLLDPAQAGRTTRRKRPTALYVAGAILLAALLGGLLIGLRAI